MFFVMVYLKKRGNGKQGKHHRIAPARWVCFGRFKNYNNAQRLFNLLKVQGVNCDIIEAITASEAREIKQT